MRIAFDRTCTSGSCVALSSAATNAAKRRLSASSKNQSTRERSGAAAPPWAAVRSWK
mgnify:CR=1 FL=1|jgi:hypothetical protein